MFAMRSSEKPEVIIESIAALEEYAAGVLNRLPAHEGEATLVGLSGDLGAGKTAFVKVAARTLGVLEEVLSPTFVLAKFYDTHGHFPWSRLVHIDAYRIDDPAELSALRWDEIMRDPHNIVFLEWPERLGATFPNDATMLRFRFVNETTRAIVE